MSIEPREIIFKVSYWSFRDFNEPTGETYLNLYIGGRTANDESVICVVKNYCPIVYVQIPENITSRIQIKAIFDYFRTVTRGKGEPTSHYQTSVRSLYTNILVNAIALTFPSQQSIRYFTSFIGRMRDCYIEGAGRFRSGDFKLNDSKIDPIISFTTYHDIKLSSWIKVKETIPLGEENTSIEDRKISTADIDLFVDCEDVFPYKFPEGKEPIVYLKFLSFDIECYSVNHNSKLPDPTIAGNCTFQISATIGTLERDSLKKYILLSLFDPLSITEVGGVKINVEIRKCKDEKDLLLKFRDLINEVNPDLFITYNGMKFDWNYLIKRAEHHKISKEFARISRLYGDLAENKTTDWSSSAYGKQVMSYYEALGRINVDVLLEVERNYRLPQYSLNVVSEKFLNEKKEDITPRQLFMLYQLTDELLDEMRNLPKGEVEQSLRIKIKKQVQEILQRRRCDGKVLKLRENLMKARNGSTFLNLVREALTLTGSYNVQDSSLTERLVGVLNLWTTMEEMSNCTGIPASYLHTRGQQIKVLSQVFREGRKMNFVIPSHIEKSFVPYQGATVLNAVPGYYEYTWIFDFESLYPSIMIAYNISYDTFMNNKIDVTKLSPEEENEYHILMWNDHIGCSHDPQHRKRKKDKIICKNVKYYFKKIKIDPENGNRQFEGLMPKLERKLLTERKAVKKILAKQQARLKMAEGTATDEEIEFYKKMAWEIIEKGSLSNEEMTFLQVDIVVQNARQNALKLSANSAYGALGAQNGSLPLVEGAESVTGMGRQTIMKALNYIESRYQNKAAKAVYGDTDSGFVRSNCTTDEEAFKYGEEISKATTHYLKTQFIHVDENCEIECPSEKKKYRIDKYPRNKINELENSLRIKIYEYDACPLNLQFENIYKRVLLLSKKRYIAYIVDKKGKMQSTRKGCAAVRRDHCPFLIKSYKQIDQMMLDNKSKEEVLNVIYDLVNGLFTRYVLQSDGKYKQIPDAEFIFYKAIGTVMEYAKQITLPSDPSKKAYIQNNANVKNLFSTTDSKDIQRFLDNGDIEIIENPIGPLDPRLEYPNTPHVMLARKMIERGDDVPPNTRLEYVILKNEYAEYQGEKAEDYTYYRENKFTSVVPLKIDPLHYLENDFIKPISELLNVKYPAKEIGYESVEDIVTRLVESSFKAKFPTQYKILKSLNTYTYSPKLPRSSLSAKSDDTFEIDRSNLETEISTIRGFIKICTECKKLTKKCFGHAIQSHYLKRDIDHDSDFETEKKLKKSDALYQFILDETSIIKSNPKLQKSYNSLVELRNACLKMKSRIIVDKLLKKHGNKKRRVKKPTQTSEKLKLVVKNIPLKVSLMRDIGKFKAGQLLYLHSCEEVANEEIIKEKVSKKEKKKYVYSLRDRQDDDCNPVLENVKRSDISPVYKVDGTILKDMLQYRISYDCVVNEIYNINHISEKRKLVKDLEEIEEEDE